MPILMGFLALALVFMLLKAYVKAPPALLARLVRYGGGFAALFAGGLLLLRGRLDMGLALGGFGAWLLRGVVAPAGMRPAGAGGAGRSRVRSAMIEMELDHATGAMSGVILAGPDEGKTLASLSRSALCELYDLCLDEDPDGARLLEAYLDRRFPGWRATGNAHDDARRAQSGKAGGRRGAAAMSEDEAYEILGLKKGAGPDEIARAHRDLMKKFHPDLGGATDLAARVNEAKDVLLRRRQ
jgi:hypothetical protein